MNSFEKFIFSRKFVAATFSVGIIFIGALVSQWIPAFKDLYSSFVTGVVGIFTAYSGANVAAGLVAKKVVPPPKDGD